jgi:hypothetical protein
MATVEAAGKRRKRNTEILRGTYTFNVMIKTEGYIFIWSARTLHVRSIMALIN